MSGSEKIDRQSDARTRKLLNRLLVVLVLVAAIAGFVLRSLDHTDPASKTNTDPSVNEAPEEDAFDPIPDPIPDPIEVP